jgi:DNA-binding LytR/AlgR family response regulator
MEQLKIAVCDDDIIIARVFAETILKVFSHYNTKASVKVFGHFYALRSEMEVEYFDLLFLDIDMPDINGIEFAKELRRKNNNVTIIYISGREELVFDTFDVSPFGFIRKTTFFNEISGVISRYLEYHGNEQFRRLTIETADDVLTLDIGNITYIEGIGKYQEIHIIGADKPIRVKSTLNFFDEKLIDHGFARSHRAYLVNCQYVRRIEDSFILLTNGETLPLSKSKAKDFKSTFMRIMA